MRPRLFLIDSFGYIFRAYHALPPLTRKSDGLQVNAVLGFCNMLWKLLAEMKDEVDEALGSLEARLDTLEEREEVTTDDVDSAIDRLRDEVAVRYAETDHDHDDAIDDAVAALERTLNNKLAGIYVRLVALEPPKEEVTN